MAISTLFIINNAQTRPAEQHVGIQPGASEADFGKYLGRRRDPYESAQGMHIAYSLLKYLVFSTNPSWPKFTSTH